MNEVSIDEFDPRLRRCQAVGDGRQRDGGHRTERGKIWEMEYSRVEEYDALGASLRPF
jgi:hypothetical protein